MAFRLGFDISDGIELALLDHRHADALFALTDRNRAQLREWLPWLDDTRTVEDSRAYIKRSLQQFTENNGFQLGIWAEGELAGAIGYHFWDWPDQKTEIGYWLGAEFQARGIVTRACRVLVDLAFDELGLNRVEIQCATDNVKSRAVPERLGFTLEGIYRQESRLYDRFVDHAMYSMLCQEWRSQG